MSTVPVLSMLADPELEVTDDPELEVTEGTYSAPVGATEIVPRLASVA